MTRVVGNSKLLSTRVISGGGLHLFSLTGVNTNAAQRYVQLFETSAVPATGDTPIFSFPVPSGQYYSFDIAPGIGVYLLAATMVNSTTVDTYTPGSSDVTFQAIIRV